MAVWFITGCTAGFGLELVKLAVKRGDQVVATARDLGRLREALGEPGDGVLLQQLDVTDAAERAAAVAAAEERFGRIDILVNNAGYGYRAAVEEGEDDAVRTLMETHFFGPVELIKAVLPGMRRRRSGRIVNVSSIGVRRSAPGSGYYAAAKNALEGVSRSLKTELAPLGIGVTVVEPGGFRTDFSGRSLVGTAVRIRDYDETAGPRRKENDHSHGTQDGDPAKGAAAIAEAAVDAPNPPLLLLLGPDAVRMFDEFAAVEQADRDTWAALSTGTDFA